jgi:hypothetical protein
VKSIDHKETQLVELSPAECDKVSGGLAPFIIGKLGVVIAWMVGKHILWNVRGVSRPVIEAHKKAHARKVRNAMSGGFGSDIRIKTDVRVEGHLSSHALTVYSWEYTDLSGERFVGVMAQDLLARDDLASAVFTFTEGPFKGFYGVNYDQLGMRCLPAEAFNGDVNSLLLQEHVTA